MQNKWKFLAMALAFLSFISCAEGVIMALLPLKKIMVDSQYIVVAKIDKLLPDKPAMSLDIVEDLKGKPTFRRLPVNLKGDKEAEKEQHTPQILKRLAPDLPLILFINFDKQTKRYISFAYTNGTWFQIMGQKTGQDSMVWSLVHGEPFLRRTFKGTTEEMKQVVVDSLAGKKEPPGVNGKEAPGFGPEVSKESK